MFRATDGVEFSPNTRGEELAIEVSKHQALEGSYKVEIDAGNTALQPRLEQVQNDLDTYQGMLDVARADPAIGNQPALGYVDVKQSRQTMTTLKDGGVRPDTTGLPLDEITDVSLKSGYPNVQHIGKEGYPGLDGIKISNLGVDLSQNGSFRSVGGQIFVDVESETVILAVNMVTRVDGNSLDRVEVPYKKVKGEWRADFNNHDVLNGVDTIRLSPGLAHDRSDHFSDANKKLAELIATKPDLQEKLGFSDDQVKMLKFDDSSPGPYTWHHVNGEGDMMLVDTNVHDMFTHTGGFSEMK